MFSCTSDRKPCCGPKIAPMVTPPAARASVVSWNRELIDDGLQTTPARRPLMRPAEIRRSDPSSVVAAGARVPIANECMNLPVLDRLHVDARRQIGDAGVAQLDAAARAREQEQS